jgi:predicted nucleic acid-binding protein
LREAGAEERRRVLRYAGKCLVIPFSSELALLSAELGRAHKLATADSIIYATARAHGADLLTCDGHFENLPGVLYVPKLQS